MKNDEECLMISVTCFVSSVLPKKGLGGDVAAPMSRTKGPAVARDYYPLECAAATAAALQMKWRRERETGILLASFVLAELCLDRSELIGQT